jgi:hypothetical protein
MPATAFPGLHPRSDLTFSQLPRMLISRNILFHARRLCPFSVAKFYLHHRRALDKIRLFLMQIYDAEWGHEKHPAALSILRKAKLAFLPRPGTWATAVECTCCGARGPLTIPDEDEALAVWSQRATTAP